LRLRKYWNGIVAVSKYIAQELVRLDADCAGRLRTIPYGINVPQSPPPRNITKNSPLRIVYAGRLVEDQKRVLMLPEIFQRLIENQIPVEITIIGDGNERNELMKRCAEFVSIGVVRFLGKLSNPEVLNQFALHDAVILTSEFEGMPVSILEAMSYGCIPVVTAVRSGIPELIEHGKNGFIVDVANPDNFVRCFRTLHEDVSRRQELSRNAYHTIVERFSLNRMVDDYLYFFEFLIQQVQDRAFVRPSGAIPYPEDIKINWKDRLPESIRLGARYLKKGVRHAMFDSSSRKKSQKFPPH
jgi:glycosyltransferase involved in cell wall biosynthesis